MTIQSKTVEQYFPVGGWGVGGYMYKVALTFDPKV